MKLLLDTCVLLWMVGEPSRISGRAREHLTQPGAELYISSISAFEIAVKYRKGKLALPLPPRRWFREAMKSYGIEELPITSEVALLAPEVAVPHSDPCDRMIVATAQLADLPLVTPDPDIHGCKDITLIW